MSKVKIQGNASGTGVVTLTAPNTNTDRTITLPDEDITLGGGVDGIVSTANATAITIDASENVGIGVTPKTTWDGSHTVLQLGARGALINDNGGLTMDANTYYNAGWKYLNTDFATSYESKSGTHKFLVAPSGTADAAISWTTPLTITNDGRGLSQFTAKAWVNFDGTGTVSIRDSHNVSSITDNGTGNYYINFSNSLASTNYSSMGGHNYNSSYDQNIRVEPNNNSRAWVAVIANGGYRDATVITALVFGD